MNFKILALLFVFVSPYAFAAGQATPLTIVWTSRAIPDNSVIEADFAHLQSMLKQLRDEGAVIVSEEYEEDTGWMPFEKEAGQDLAQVITKQTLGCRVIDENCKKLISFYNRSKSDEMFDLNFSGSLMIPVRQLDGKIVVDVGNRHRTEKEGRVSTTYIDRKIENIIKQAPRNIPSRITRVCDFLRNICWDSKVVIEEEIPSF